MPDIDRVYLVTGAASGIGRATANLLAAPALRSCCTHDRTQPASMPQPPREDVLEERIPNRAGHVVVPDGPGLGVRVNEASVRANADSQKATRPRIRLARLR
jgi:NAD(P)-dependent dehydrogenase (short-subunit alcohol dehydrogenase family)